MPRYQVEIGGKRFEIEAPTPEAAQGAVQRMQPQAAAPDATMRGRFDDALPSVETRQRVVTVPSRQILGPIYDHRSYVMDGEANPRDPALQSALQERAAGVREKINQGDDLPMWEEFDSPVRRFASGVPVFGALADQKDPRPEQDARFAAQYPAADKLLPLAGGMAATGLAAGTRLGQTLFGITGPNTAARIATGGMTGATIGGADAGIRSDWDPVSMGIGGIVGGVTGGAIPAIGSKLGKWFGGRPSQRAVPTVEELRRMKNNLYQAADRVDLRVSQPSFSNFASNWAKEARTLGFSARSHGTIADALDEAGDMMGVANTPSLRDLDRLRQMLRSGKPEEREIGRRLIERLDAYIERLGPTDVVSGDPRTASALIRQARDMNGRYRKGELIEELFTNAKDTVGANYTSASMTTAIRQEFRKLLKDRDQLRFFTTDEVAAIRGVVRGDPITNAMRLLGKFAPTGLLSATLSGGAGGLVGGTPGAIALPALGWLAKQGADSRTSAAALHVSDVVRNGGRLPPPPPASRRMDEATTRFLQSVAMPAGPLLAPRLSPTK